MTADPPVVRLAAFTDDPRGGNPAGVAVSDELPDAVVMRRVAAAVGYSETAFLAPAGDRAFTVRYFAPEAEVTFCGHATVAAGVLLGERDGPARYRFDTRVGAVDVDVAVADGRVTATLTSVVPQQRVVPPDELDRALRAFGWDDGDLDPELAPAEAYAGAWHLIVGLRDRARLRAMSYDYDVLRAWMVERDVTTVQVLWREDRLTFHARDPFPVGGVVEDPATGAAAAALGGYLRRAGLVPIPASVVVHQGEDMGRPSTLRVDIPPAGGIRVSGTAVHLPG